jgi:hypothetical protein
MQTDLRAITPQQPFDAVGGERAPAVIQEQVRVSGGRPGRQPGVQERIRLGTQQHDALLAPFAAHSQPGRLVALRRTEQVGQLHSDNFAHRRPPRSINTNQAWSREEVMTDHNCATSLSRKSRGKRRGRFPAWRLKRTGFGQAKSPFSSARKSKNVFKAATRRLTVVGCKPAWR